MKRIIILTVLCLSLGVHAAQGAQQLTEEQARLNQELLWAVQSDETTEKDVQALLKKGASFKQEGRFWGEDPLNQAISCANLHLVPTLQPKRFENSGSHYDTCHAARVVAMLCHRSFCDALGKKVTSEVDIDGCSRYCFMKIGIDRYGSLRALREAAFDTIEYLVARGSDVNASTSSSWEEPALCSAGLKSDPTLCALLLRLGADPQKHGRWLERMEQGSFEALAQRDPALQQVLNDHLVESQPNRKQQLAIELHEATVLPTAVINLIIKKIY